MVREGFVKFNLNRIIKYTQKLERRHRQNIKKIGKLKNAYIQKARELEEENKDILHQKDVYIEELKFQINKAQEEKERLYKQLSAIPKPIIDKFVNN